MTETIELSEEEMEIVQQVAKEMDINLNQAAQLIIERGVQGLLADISPTTMALNGVLRASKVQSNGGAA